MTGARDASTTPVGRCVRWASSTYQLYSRKCQLTLGHGRSWSSPAEINALPHSFIRVPDRDLLEAGRNCFRQRSFGVVVIQRPNVGAAKLLLFNVGRLRCYRSGIVVGIEDSARWIVERRSDSHRIVPGGKSIFIREILNGRVGGKSRGQHGVAAGRSSGFIGVPAQT